MYVQSPARIVQLSAVYEHFSTACLFLIYFTAAWHSCLVPEIIYGLMWMIRKPDGYATERFLGFCSAVNFLQATKSAVGGDKLPPPITPEHNPLSVPGQDQLNGNELNGHPSNEGEFPPPTIRCSMQECAASPELHISCSGCGCLCPDVHPSTHFCRHVICGLSRCACTSLYCNSACQLCGTYFLHLTQLASACEQVRPTAA